MDLCLDSHFFGCTTALRWGNRYGVCSCWYVFKVWSGGDHAIIIPLNRANRHIILDEKRDIPIIHIARGALDTKVKVGVFRIFLYFRISRWWYATRSSTGSCYGVNPNIQVFKILTCEVWCCFHCVSNIPIKNIVLGIPINGSSKCTIGSETAGYIRQYLRSNIGYSKRWKVNGNLRSPRASGYIVCTHHSVEHGF